MGVIPTNSKKKKKQKMKDSFQVWMKKVNAAIEAKCGMTADEIEDTNYSEMWERGVTPKSAAAKAVKQANG